MSNSKKHLGLYTLTGLVVANMIGAGVFTTSGFAIGDLGSPHWVMLAWLIGGCIAFCGAISYGLLAKRLPESGGEYIFLSQNIHPMLGFIAGWVSLLAGFTGAIAYAAMSFEAYILTSDLRNNIPANIIATGIILLAMLIHTIKMGYGAIIQNTIVVLKTLLIVGLLGLAIYYVSDPSIVLGPSTNNTIEQPPSFSIYTFALTVMWVSFSYSGFNAAVYISSEVANAKINVPRSMLLGTALVTIIYLGLNAVFVYLLPSAVIAHQQDIAVIVAQSLGGDAFVIFVRFVIAIALFTSVSAMLMLGPRVYAKMAADGFLPNILEIKGEIPKNAIFLQAILAIALVWISTLRELLSYLGFTLTLCLAITILSLFFVKSKLAMHASFWVFPFAPAIFIVATIISTLLAAINEPMEMLASIITFISGALAYLLIKKYKNTT